MQKLTKEQITTLQILKVWTGKNWKKVLRAAVENDSFPQDLYGRVSTQHIVEIRDMNINISKIKL